MLFTGCVSSGAGRSGFSKWMKAVDTSYLRVGMTIDQVKDVVRFPTRVNKSTDAYGHSEQWVYEGGEYGTDYYLYFDNGLLSGWQEY